MILKRLEASFLADDFHSHNNTIQTWRYSRFVFFYLERIVFTGKVIKYNRFGMKQDRTILLTNLFLSNIKKKGKFKRINSLFDKYLITWEADLVTHVI